MALVEGLELIEEAVDIRARKPRTRIPCGLFKKGREIGQLLSAMALECRLQLGRPVTPLGAVEAQILIGIALDVKKLALL